MKTVFCTKYALTQGIIESEVIEIDERYAQVKWPGMPNGWHLLGKGDWYPTLEQAEARVDRMRRDKIKSLNEQIEKLSKYQPKVKRLSNGE